MEFILILLGIFAISMFLTFLLLKWEKYEQQKRYEKAILLIQNNADEVVVTDITDLQISKLKEIALIRNYATRQFVAVKLVSPGILKPVANLMAIKQP